jgi:phosphoglycolate phosphatase-like HAD superfamily hydrolase
VITSEQKYWDTARLTVRELLESDDYLSLPGYFAGQGTAQPVIPEPLIYRIKNQAINSNWDLTYLVAAMHLIRVTGDIWRQEDYDWSLLFDSTLPVADKLQRIGKVLATYGYTPVPENPVIDAFFAASAGRQGAALLDWVADFARARLGGDGVFFEVPGEFWQFCHTVFQEWFEGRRQSSFAAQQPASALPAESTVIDAAQIARVLAALQQRYTLGIATGRPRREALAPLQAFDLLRYFDAQRIVTYDEVQQAQAGTSELLGKPHPFVLLRAIYPAEDAQTLAAGAGLPSAHPHVAYIGDSASDALAAQRAGCVALGVLSGVAPDEDSQQARRSVLQEAGCVLVLPDVRALPQALGLAG